MTAHTPNLPALITALPGPGSEPGAGDRARAPQTEFTRARQVLFLENLSITGSVRSAASAAQVSHQSAYRARRATGAFRTAWDAALVVARANAEGMLAARAIDGVTEEVRYHGEVVGTRTRFSDRLLLAHLGRLDRLAERPDAAGFAEDWEAELARFERGEEVLATRAAAPVPAPTQSPEKHSPEPCNTRSMSNTVRDAADVYDEDDYDDEDALEEAMAEARPIDAPPLARLGDPDQAAQCQREAFELGDEDWWRYGAGFTAYVRDGAGGWMPDPEETARRLADHAAGFGSAALSDADEAEADSGEGAHDEGACDEDADDEDEHDEDVDHDGSSEDAPFAAAAASDEVEPASAGPLVSAGSGLARYSRWRPIDDGRLQPYYGRGW